MYTGLQVSTFSYITYRSTITHSQQKKKPRKKIDRIGVHTIRTVPDWETAQNMNSAASYQPDRRSCHLLGKTEVSPTHLHPVRASIAACSLQGCRTRTLIGSAVRRSRSMAWIHTSHHDAHGVNAADAAPRPRVRERRRRRRSRPHDALLQLLQPGHQHHQPPARHEHQRHRDDPDRQVQDQHRRRRPPLAAAFFGDFLRPPSSSRPCCLTFHSHNWDGRPAACFTYWTSVALPCSCSRRVAC